MLDISEEVLVDVRQAADEGPVDVPPVVAELLVRKTGFALIEAKDDNNH